MYEFVDAEQDLPVQFEIYKADEEQRRWVPMDNLGHKVVFLCKDGNFILSAKQFPDFKKNSIYFNFPFVHVYPFHPSSHVALFDIEQGFAMMLSTGSHLLWPPPSWIAASTSGTAST